MIELLGVVVYSFVPRSARRRRLGGIAGDRPGPGAIVARLQDGTVHRLETAPGQYFKAGDSIIVVTADGNLEEKGRYEIIRVEE